MEERGLELIGALLAVAALKLVAGALGAPVAPPEAPQLGPYGYWGPGSVVTVPRV